MPKLSVPAQPAAPLEEELRRLHYEISLLYQAARYHQAMPLAERYVALARSLVGDDHPTYAAAITSLSLLYRGQGRYAEAEPLIKRALGIDEKALGPEHLNVGASSTTSPSCTRSRAASLRPSRFSVAFSISEKALGPEHPRVGDALNNLAWLYQAQGRYTEAEPLVKRALTAVVETAQGPEHADVGRMRHAGKAQRGLRPGGGGRAALPTGAGNPRRRLWGRTIPRSRSCAAISGACANPRAASARPNRCSRARWRARRRPIGSDHPAVAFSLTQLGDLYREQGQCERAEPLFVRALAMSKGDIQEVPVLFGTDRGRDGSKASAIRGQARRRPGPGRDGAKQHGHLLDVTLAHGECAHEEGLGPLALSLLPIKIAAASG